MDVINMTLPSFAIAAERRRLQHARSYRSIPHARRALSNQPAGRRCFLKEHHM